MNIKFLLAVFIVSLSLFSAACKCAKGSDTAATSTSRESTNKGIVAPPGSIDERIATNHSSIAPGTCRIQGTVVQILPARDADKSTPCGQMPCEAIIQVDQVVGCGSGVTTRPKQQQQVKMYFTLTLGANSTSSPALPGLEVGSSFQADVQVPVTGTEYRTAVYKKL